MTKTAVFILLLSGIFPGNVSGVDDVIMHVGGEAVTLGDIEWFVSKPYSEAGPQVSLEERIRQYALNRQKVMAAHDAGLDTLQAFRNEFGEYKDLLAVSYLTDSVYERELTERNPENVALDMRKRREMIQRHQNVVLSSRHHVRIDSTLLKSLSDCRQVYSVAQDSEGIVSSEKGDDPVLFSIDGEATLLSDFEDYLAGVRVQELSGPMIGTIFEGFLNQRLQEAEKVRLYREDAGYRHLLDEWRDGMLLYSISLEKVWRHPEQLQDSMESEWRRELNEKFPVEVNEDLLKRLK